MRKRLKTIGIFLVAVTGLLIVLFLTWALWIPDPMPEARIEVSQSPYLTFWNKQDPSKLGVIIYPGARVDARAYAPLARAIAELGHTVVVPSMPLNFAVVAPNRAADVQSLHPDIDRWVLMGHSLGGTMAADFGSRNR